jgi:XisH protein
MTFVGDFGIWTTIGGNALWSMPAKDFYHDTVKTALIKDGWVITDDPLSLRIGDRNASVDLGAERLIAAQKGLEKIAVEIKSFLGPSPMTELEKAWGQYFLYKRVLGKRDPERCLYLAVSQTIFETLFQEEVGLILLEEPGFRLVVFSADTEEILQW